MRLEELKRLWLETLPEDRWAIIFLSAQAVLFVCLIAWSFT